MIYADLKLNFCPFCGAKISSDLYCESCGKSLHILTEYGHIPPELISSIQWDTSISETQKNIIIELLSELVRIEGGSFTMGMFEINGSPLKQPSLQTPHRVTLSTFYISKFLVTQRQWFAFMPNHTCCNIGDELPVDSISWEDCIEFTNRLRKLSNIPFSLPTEAQWLFVAQERNQFYDKSFAGFDNLEQCAWTTDNSNGHSHRPGLKMPNGLGIYDLCGNLSEHCLDRWGNWPKDAISNPYRPIGTGGNMVRKGGSYHYKLYDEFESAYHIMSRDCRSESSRMEDSGLRLAVFDVNTLTEYKKTSQK